MNFDADFQTRQCRSLLASVVGLAVQDACIAPHKDGRMATEAFTAMRFFYTSPGLNEYAEWLDFDADQFRERLITLMRERGPHVINGFDPMKRRNFCLNLALRRQLPQNYEPMEDE